VSLKSKPQEIQITNIKKHEELNFICAKLAYEKLQFITIGYFCENPMEELELETLVSVCVKQISECLQNITMKEGVVIVCIIMQYLKP
jgi:hypothetical protein